MGNFDNTQIRLVNKERKIRQLQKRTGKSYEEAKEIIRQKEFNKLSARASVYDKMCENSPTQRVQKIEEQEESFDTSYITIISGDSGNCDCSSDCDCGCDGMDCSCE